MFKRKKQNQNASKICLNCGNQLSNNSKYCPECGNETNNATILLTDNEAKKKNKKKYILVICVILFLFFVFSDNCNHSWQDATCESPTTCKLCGKTKGKPLNHEWIEATCKLPKHCNLCKKADGEKLGHDWQGGTCTEPKICTRCSEEETIGHTWVEATYKKPKTCSVCGETIGKPLVKYEGTTINVVKAYESALSYAKKNGYDADYAYNDIRNRLVEINSAAYMGDKNTAQLKAWKVLSGDVDKMSLSELQSKAQSIMKFIVPDSSDRLSALMKKFKQMNSVSGKITTTEINIEVKDMDKFVKEIGLLDSSVGGVLAMLNIYDYSWIDTKENSLLQFTETGFTFNWKSVGDYKLSLN